MAAEAEVRGHPSQARRRRFTGGRERPEVEVVEEDAPPVYVGRGWLADEADPADEAGDGDEGQGDGDRGRGGRGALKVPKPFRATSRTLVVEFVLCLVLVALKPKEPASPGKASEAIVPQFVAVAFVFLALAALGAAGPRAQRVANLFGALVTLVLAFKNHANVKSAVVSVTGGQTSTAPAMAPDIGNAPPPTSANNPYPGGISGRDEQTAISGWRGSAPMTSANNPYPGGISGRA